MRNIFSRFSKQYDAWYDRNKYAYLSELRAIRKILPKKGNGLEVGVGTGRFAAPLGIRVGIDPSREMIKIARQRGVDARFGYGESLPFRDESFDYVVLIVTLCFVKNPQKVLREAKRVVKKNGRLIVGIVDKNSFLGKSYQEKRSVFYKSARFFSAEELIRELNAEKFSRILCYQTLLKPPDKTDKIETPQKGFGRGGFVAISASKK